MVRGLAIIMHADVMRVRSRQPHEEYGSNQRPVICTLDKSALHPWMEEVVQRCGQPVKSEVPRFHFLFYRGSSIIDDISGEGRDGPLFLAG